LDGYDGVHRSRAFNPEIMGQMTYAQHSKVMRLRVLLADRALDPPKNSHFKLVPLDVLW